MAKPEVLEIVDVHPGTTAELEEAYTVHKLWRADDAAAFLARVGPGVGGIATNGIAGTKGVPLAAGDVLPPDLGGSATTAEITARVCSLLAGSNA